MGNQKEAKLKAQKDVDTKILGSAASAASRRNKKRDPNLKYYIVIGTVGALMLFCIVLALTDSLKKDPSKMTMTAAAADYYVNDETKMAEYDRQADDKFKTGASPYFNGWTLADVQSLSGTFYSQRTSISGHLVEMCSVDETMETSVMTKYDARTETSCFNRPVYDQKKCNGSYAITAAQSLAARWCQADPDNEASQNIQLSAQQILSCGKKTSKGCRGGNVDLVWEQLETQGLYPEKCLPYKGLGKPDAACKNDCKKETVTSAGCDESMKKKALEHCVLGLGSDDKNPFKNIKKEIKNNGPVVMPLVLFQDFLVYKEGVYSPVASAMKVLTKDGTPVLHSVLVLGWGTSKGVKYWLVENSWGKEWGEEGYARIAEKSVLIEEHTIVGSAATPENVVAKEKADKEKAEAEAIKKAEYAKDREARKAAKIAAAEAAAREKAEETDDLDLDADFEEDDLDDLDLDDLDAPEAKEGGAPEKDEEL